MKTLLSTVVGMALAISSYGQYTLQKEDISVTESGIIVGCSKKFSANEKDIIIPETVNGITIRGIQDRGCYMGIFYQKGLTSVQFPATMEYIGNNAFRGNPLSGTLDLTKCPNLRFIGVTSFYQCRLTGVDFTGSVKLETIGAMAFYANKLTGSLDFSNCASLQLLDRSCFFENQLDDVHFGGVNIKTLGYNAFASNQLVEVDLSNCTNLNVIEGFAFRNNIIKTVNLAGCTSLEIINGKAFSQNQIDELVLTDCDKLRKIGYNAFANNNLTSLNLNPYPLLTQIESSAFEDNQISELYYDNCTLLTEIGDYAFYNNQLTTSQDLTAMSHLTYIGKEAFSNQSVAISMTLPDLSSSDVAQWMGSDMQYYPGGSVTSQTDLTYMAEKPYVLTDADVVVQNNVLKQCNYGFANKSIVIPSRLDGQEVRELGKQVFHQTTLLYARLPSTLKRIGDYAFSGSTIKILDADLSVDLDTIGNGAFQYTALRVLNLHGHTKLTSIGYGAFEHNQLSRLDLSGCTRLEEIQNSAFMANSLEYVDLRNCIALKDIGENAFSWNRINDLKWEGCTALSDISDYAFANNRLASIDLGEVSHIESIGAHAFDANQLQAIEGVASCERLIRIGANAFSDNENLVQTIYLPSPTSDQANKVFWQKQVEIADKVEDQYVLSELELSYTKAYTVEFADYDDTILKKDTLQHGAAITPPEDPEREDYLFIGWAPTIKTVTGALTIQAQYERSDADNYVFKIKTKSGKPLQGFDITIDGITKSTNGHGMVLFPTIAEGCHYTISYAYMLDDIEGDIEAGTAGSMLEFNDLSEVHFDVSGTDFNYKSGFMQLGKKSFDFNADDPMIIYLPDGSYEYRFYHRSDQSPILPRGDFEVDGTDLNVPVLFYPSLFTIKTAEDSLIQDAIIVVHHNAATYPNIDYFTDEVGEATIYLPNGTYTYTLTHPRVGVEWEGSFTVADESHQEEVVLYMADFVVKADYDKPLTGAKIIIGDKEVYTDDSGVGYIFLPPGSYEYTVAHPDCGVNQVEGSLTISDNSITTNIALNTTTFEVAVNGRPLDDVRVSIADKTYYTDQNGVVETSLPTGTYTAVFHHDNLNEDFSRTIEVRYSAQTIPVDLYEVIFHVGTSEEMSQEAVVTIDDQDYYTDSNGELTLYLPGESTYTYQVHAEAVLGQVSGLIEGSLEETVTAYAVLFQLSSASGNPSVGTSIYIGESEEETVEDGTASFLTMPGTYTYDIPGFDTSAEVVVTNENVTVEVASGYQVDFELSIDGVSELIGLMDLDRKIAVTIGDNTVYNKGEVIRFYMKPGTYSYRVHSDYRPGEIEGTVQVTNASVNVPITLRYLYLYLNNGEEKVANADISFNGQGNFNNCLKATNNGVYILEGVFPGDYSLDITAGSVMGQYHTDMTVAAYEEGNPFKAISKTYDLPISAIDFNVYNSGNEGASLENVQVDIDDATFYTDASGNVSFTSFPETWSYTITYEGYSGNISGDIVAAEGNAVLKDVPVLLASFNTNFGNISINENEYAGSRRFLLPEGSHDYAIFVGTFPEITGAFSASHTEVTQYFYLSEFSFVDAVDKDLVSGVSVSFLGVVTDQTGTDPVNVLLYGNGYENEVAIEASGYKDTTMVMFADADQNYTIELTPKEAFGVTFKDWDGTIISQQTVYYGESATLPSPPERSRFLFMGWFTDEDIEWSSYESITSEVVVTARYSAITEIEESASDDIKLYPNPVEDVLTIEMDPSYKDKLEASGITIVDVTGKVVWQMNQWKEKQSVDLHFLKRGVYVIKAGPVIKKFVKGY